MNKSKWIGLGLSLSALVNAQDWKTSFEQQLPYLGHRNWILIVDKAFPAQTSPGIDVFYTNDDIEKVASYVLDKIKNADHIRPVIYLDKELDYLTDKQVKNVEKMKRNYQKLFKDYPNNTLWHESVFAKIDEASEQFRIIVLKTNTLMPYSSVFIELDCGYWDEKSEQTLRGKIQDDTK
ncbi:MAG: hypothetical protein LBR49_09160 [Tannerella sp.]|jgi:D-ribose pyranose/furanose isomerase RbsD|nr:hypothetical protein [Tannerella sp.]